MRDREKDLTGARSRRLDDFSRSRTTEKPFGCGQSGDNPIIFPEAMELPEAAFWKEALPRRCETEAKLRLQPSYVLSSGNFCCCSYYDYIMF